MSAADEDAAVIRGPAPGGVGLLIIDMINDLSFPNGEKLRLRAERVADRLLPFRDRALAARVPVIYVNDNFGRWHSDRDRIVEACLAESNPGRDITRRMAPRPDDFFVIKPRFSGFYATNLPVLLPRLGVNRLILSGVAADICVLFTAADAHMREYQLWAPRDLVGSEDEQRTAWALEIMQNSMDAEVRATGELALEDWIRAPPNAPPPPRERAPRQGCGQD